MPPHIQLPTPVRTFTQRFSSTPRGARLARRLTKYHLAEWGVPYLTEPSETATQIVAELAANAITHGRVPGRDFELCLTYTEEEIRIEVSDPRAEFGPRVREREWGEPQPAGGDGGLGQGLRLIEALAAEWGVAGREVGKTVWARLDLSPR
ncbi:ATP-binding protein [Actinomycetota bacterium Odt1-20B]